MAGGGMGVSWVCFALLTVATAGPLHRVPRESEDYQNDLSAYANYTANEVCFSEGEVFQKGDVMPNPGPCEECRCEPPSIVCNMIKCPVNNNGCRTIQRANHCCPDYNCECDYNGQLYNDGERLDLPEEPCQVCYCKGGEVMCNSITCYHRDDCDPVQVEGQCCPKYDNCPVRDMGSSSAEDKNVLVRSTNKTNYVPPKREMNPWLLTKIPPPSSPSPPKAANPSTEGSGVIIVSDWLTERRTTTEDGGRSDYSAMFTDVPDMSSTSGHSSGPAMVKSQGTFTPVDEVIFTRIDGENVNKEANVESTTIPSKPEDKLTSTEANITEDPVGSKNDENLKEFDSSKSPIEKQDISEVRPLDIIVNTSTTTESSIKIEKLSMNSSFGVSSKTSDKNKTSIGGSTSKPVFEEAEKVTTNNDENDAIVGNILDLDGLSIGEDESETTTKDELDYSSTLSEDFTSRFIDVNENSIENQTKGESKVGQVKLSQDEIKTTFERFSGTTPSSGIGDDATTPFFTEVSLGKQSLSSNDEPTGLPKIKIEGDQTSNKNDTMTSTSDHESSTNEITLPPVTEAAKTKSPVEVKIKRNNLNDTGVRGNSTEKTGSPITLNSNESEITPTSQVAEMKNANVNHLNLGKATPSSEAKEISLPTSSENETNFGLESTSDIPPVLELNSNVPFLQLGGHENTDNDDNTTDEGNETTPTFQTEITIAVTDSVSNLTSDNLNKGSLKETNATLVSADVVSKTVNNNQSKSEEIKKSDVGNEKLQSETTTDAIFPTTHIPLTPGDLRIIAEYLINDTIKTVPVNNESDYAPNSWLKGNLTSEEKMTSILSAANVSIAIMNKTDDKVKKIMTDPTEKPGSDVKSGRFEKEKVSGNNALNDLKIGNKTGFILGKGDAYSDSPKINPDHEAPLNDDAKASEAGNVVSNTTNKLIKEATLTTSTTPSVERTSSSQMEKDSGYNLSFDKVNPGRAEAKQDSRDVPLQSDKLSGETTTTDLPQKLSAH